jgi:hypothetical protein
MAKNGVFNQPIAPAVATKREKSPFGMEQPGYDDRKNLGASGTYYGTGFKAKVGRMRGDSAGQNPVPQKNLAIPPKSTV